MQAIRTIRLTPTDTRGERMKATAAAGSVTVEYDHRIDYRANHRAVAEALIEKMGWKGPAYGQLVTGCLPDRSYCHVMTGRDGIGG